MQFKDVIGQHELKKRLIKSVKAGRISHALLFLGESGYGGLPLALAYGQFVNCEDKGEQDSCGTCKSCIKFQKLAHPDLHFAFPVIKTDTNKEPKSDDFIQKWREKLLDNPYITQNQWYEHIGVENKQGIIAKNESYEILRKLNLKTFEADYKIMLVWLPEKMNQSAANKLLKILEEPSPNTLFLFVSDNAESLLPTIISRLQLMKIPKINQEDLSRYFVEKHQLSENHARDISLQSMGNYITALQYHENEDTLVYNHKQLIELMRIAYQRNLLTALKWVDSIAGIGREKQKLFFDYALRIVRESFALSQGLRQITNLGKEEREFAEKFSGFINPSNIGKINDEINKAYLHIEMNGYSKLVFYDLSIQLMKYIKT